MSASQQESNFLSSKILYMETLHRKYTRALTFENICQKSLIIVSKETYDSISKETYYVY